MIVLSLWDKANLLEYRMNKQMAVNKILIKNNYLLKI
jgi:hypothetical protein